MKKILNFEHIEINKNFIDIPMYVLETKNKKGFLKIKFNCLEDDFLIKIKINHKKIFDFVSKNKKYKNSIGVFTLYDDYLLEFKDAKKLTIENILTILEICRFNSIIIN